jgi:hypothetical protein
MKRGALAILLAAVCLLTGCSSLLDRTYSVAEEHSSKYWESGTADTLRAESYQDIVNDLLLVVGQQTETALIRLYNYTDKAAVADDLERAAAEVQLETAMGAYAVDYITSESQRQRGYFEVNIRVGYRRSVEQIQNIVNATSTAALPALLNTALEEGKTELAVRIGYWGSDGAERVEEAVAAVREQWGLEAAEAWTVSYYPREGTPGLVEFVMESQPSETLAEALPVTGESA